jgi:hypothetical protein
MPIARDWKGAPVFQDAPQVSVEPIDLGAPEDYSKPNVVQTEDGTTVTTLDNGDVIIGQGGTGLGAANDDNEPSSFDDNLAIKAIPPQQLSALSADLLDGIETDIRSRSAMVAMYNKGIDLLGLKMEDRSGRRQRKNVSTVRHPVLLAAVVDFQSSFVGEMLPASGPCKGVVEGGSPSGQDDELAQQLEEDFNHYLTTTATEYYPDTDRGAFYLGYGGTLFKKIYKCPLRKRPVIECVYLTDLIVSESATDLDNALRVTHKIEMSQSQVRRMQLAKVWRDVKLSTPSLPADPTKQKEKQTQGLNSTGPRPRDIPHTVYECCCEIVPEDYGFDEKGAPEDLPLPYRVTIDKDSQIILDVRRNWDENDKEYKKDLPFVDYMLVPGMGYLGLGYLHLLGNQTMALTAIWRILVDAGMFNNFPGGMRVKGTRQSTNEINPGPGEWPEVDTGPMDDIRKAFMPMPYKEPSAVFIQLAEIIAQGAEKIGGAVNLEIGEGRQNVPVGTMLAMIEQQTKTMAAVHKRLHQSQKRELMKLKKLFMQDPEPLYRSNPKARQWQAAELTNLNIVPNSDPNVPAQMHRIMQATALITLAQQAPMLYDQFKVHEHALKTIGISNPEEIIHQPPPQQAPPDPAVIAAQMQAQLKQQELQQNMQIKQAELQQDSQQQQREAADRVVQAQTEQKKLAVQTQADAAEMQSRERIAQMKEETARIKLDAESRNAAHDRASDLIQHFNPPNFGDSDASQRTQ